MTAEALEARVAILRTVKESLFRQRDNLQRYLRVLTEQRKAVESRDAERIALHVELEQSVIRDITSLQKVIVPLRELYSRRYGATEDETAGIERSVENLRQKALEKNRENRSLLKTRMAVIRNEIFSLRKNIRVRSPFSDIGVPTMIDIRT